MFKLKKKRKHDHEAKWYHLHSVQKTDAKVICMNHRWRGSCFSYTVACTWNFRYNTYFISTSPSASNYALLTKYCAGEFQKVPVSNWIILLERVVAHKFVILLHIFVASGSEKPFTVLKKLWNRYLLLYYIETDDSWL